MNFEKLYKALETTDTKDFYLFDGNFMIEINKIKISDIPDILRIYSTISQWIGNSLRSGVWTYYEVANMHDLHITRQYLSRCLWKELDCMFAFGIHNYQSPEFVGNFNYPQQWIDESTAIDEWIQKNENKLYKWQKEFLITHRNEICELQNRTK